MKVLPKISIGQFEAACETLSSLGGDHEIRLREGGDTLAITSWELWEVKFYDLFRSDKTIAQKKRDVIQIYLNAIANESDDEMEFHASSKYMQLVKAHREIPGNEETLPKTNERMLNAIADHLRQLGITAAAHNNKKIEFAAHRASVADIDKDQRFFSASPSLAKIVNPVVKKFAARAIELKLPKTSIAAITGRTVDPEKLGSAYITLPGISDAIENALYKKARTSLKSPSALVGVLYSEDLALAGRAAVAHFLARQVNTLTYDKLTLDKPTSKRLPIIKSIMDKENIDMAVITKESTPEQIDIEVRNAIGFITKLLSEEEIGNLRDTITRALLAGSKWETILAKDYFEPYNEEEEDDHPPLSPAEQKLKEMRRTDLTHDTEYIVIPDTPPRPPEKQINERKKDNLPDAVENAVVLPPPPPLEQKDTQ